MQLTRIVFLLVLISFFSCQHKVTTSIYQTRSPIDYKEKITVISIYDNTPKGSSIIGQVDVGANGFSTNCGYEVALNKAKLEARKLGGNAIKITQHRPPTAFGNSCHRISANILFIEDKSGLELSKDLEPILDSMLNLDYAILKIYRPGGLAPLFNYDLYLGDSIIYRVKNKYKSTLHIKKEGYTSIWTNTITRAQIPIKIEKGRTYYIKCGVIAGRINYRPSLELVDSRIGEDEFNALKSKNK